MPSNGTWMQRHRRRLVQLSRQAQRSDVSAARLKIMLTAAGELFGLPAAAEDPADLSDRSSIKVSARACWTLAKLVGYVTPGAARSGNYRVSVCNATAAKALGITRRTLQRHLAELECAGWILRHMTGGDLGLNRAGIDFGPMVMRQDEIVAGLKKKSEESRAERAALHHCPTLEALRTPDPHDADETPGRRSDRHADGYMPEKQRSRGGDTTDTLNTEIRNKDSGTCSARKVVEAVSIPEPTSPSRTLSLLEKACPELVPASYFEEKTKRGQGDEAQPADEDRSAVVDRAAVEAAGRLGLTPAGIAKLRSALPGLRFAQAVAICVGRMALGEINTPMGFLMSLFWRIQRGQPINLEASLHGLAAKRRDPDAARTGSSGSGRTRSTRPESTGPGAGPDSPPTSSLTARSTRRPDARRSDRPGPAPFHSRYPETARLIASLDIVPLIGRCETVDRARRDRGLPPIGRAALLANRDRLVDELVALGLEKPQ
jgi:hypothetical protein